MTYGHAIRKGLRDNPVDGRCKCLTLVFFIYSIFTCIQEEYLWSAGERCLEPAPGADRCQRKRPADCLGPVGPILLRHRRLVLRPGAGQQPAGSAVGHQGGRRRGRLGSRRRHSRGEPGRRRVVCYCACGRGNAHPAATDNAEARYVTILK